MLKNLKIGARLMISYAIIVAITIGISFVALSAFTTITNDLKDFTSNALRAADASMACRIEINVAARNVREMLIDKDTSSYVEYKKGVNDNLAALNDNLAVLEDSYQGDDKLITEYKTEVASWIKIANNIVAEIDKGNDDVAGVMLINQCAPSLEKLIALSGQISTNTDTMKDDVLQNSAGNMANSRVVVFVLLIVAIIFSVIIAIVTTKGIVGPVRQVENAAKQMTVGILKTHIEYKSKDEIGQMADSMRASMDIISQYIADIDRALEMMKDGDFNIYGSLPYVGDFANIETSFVGYSVKMSQIINQINSSADLVSDGSTAVSHSSQELSQGSTEQASSIEELSATITEITEQVKKTANNAGEAKKKSDYAASMVGESNTHMQDMIGAMNQISDKSSEIGKIIKTIDDIAFQTNILALNAAVEAARAGAAGKGFAVVADEVRNLAQKSAEAAKNTTALIEETVNAVSNGTVIAGETATAMQSVVEGTNIVSELIGEIATASGEQASSISQINIGIEQISSVVQTNSATSEESAASAEELSGQSEILKSLVHKFVVRRDLDELVRTLGLGSEI